MRQKVSLPSRSGPLSPVAQLEVQYFVAYKSLDIKHISKNGTGSGATALIGVTLAL